MTSSPPRPSTAPDPPPRPQANPSPAAAGQEQESVLSLFLRGVFWSLLAGLLLITFSPYQAAQLRVRLPWEASPYGTSGGLVYLPTPTGTNAAHVGIVAGHWGLDSGATCPNGVTEQQVNYEIARRVQQKLEKAGVKVDLLQEKDPRLQNYRADVLLSIHADVCVWPPEYGEKVSGFKLAFASAVPQKVAIQAAQFKRCLEYRYSAITGLTFHPSTITRDMTEYHAFDEIDPNTPAVIIETGFLAHEKDYNLLVNHPDQVAQGIAASILCYLRNEPLVLPTGTAPAASSTGEP
ncbi:MAG TPA: N-acetylmuramoyl-L-alanine amidase [Anaerolineae bacterium]|nr:N-acetylmuramoyl-L-alanine amidase [Anaerolineae bacterium]HID84101.1 hypothetical protein [Anaerolineales bacterium]HIQ08336.1 hypothetical protein [Anaerolineaceae bacterium]